VHVYDGFWQPGARCGLQIFPGADSIPLVVLTELPFNNNTSVTNLVEYLAAELLASYLPEYVGQSHPFTASSTTQEEGDRSCSKPLTS
jgi:hypothetical protein